MVETNAGGVGKNSPLSTKTVQDRRIVSIKIEWEVVYALSNGYVVDDLR